MSHLYNRTAGLKVFFALLGAGCFFALIYFLASLGPTEVVTDSDLAQLRSGTPDTDPRLKTSRELIETYDALVSRDEATAGDVALLERALEGMNEVILTLGSRDFGLEAERDRLRRRINDLKGRELAEEAAQLEQRAAAIESESPDEALPLFQRALRIREQIQRDFRDSSAHSPQRVSSLKRKVEFLEMRPLKDRSLRLEAEGDAALAEGNWELAQKHFQESAEIQEYINVNSPVGQLGDLRRSTTLRDKEASVISGPIFSKVESITKQAEVALESGLYDEAARLFERAEKTQADLNREYPRSYYASRERESTLRQQAADARSLIAFKKIEEADSKLTDALRGRNVAEAIDRVDQLREQIRIYRTRHIGSTHPLAPIERRTNYLASRRNDLGPIQDAVYGQSIRLVTSGNLLMFRSEVPQWLYEIVIGSNPSREVGLNQPVESVTYAEAVEFCDLLGILLARRVRLASVEEMDRAVGNRAETGNPERVWSSQAGSSTPQSVASSKPNPVGFYDLLGNVAEWTLASPSGTTFTYGGTIRDLLSVINTAQPALTPRTERSRLIGFRFVIEIET